MGLNLAQLRIQMREHLGMEGDDIITLPDQDSATKTGADTYINRSFWEILEKFKFREEEFIATFSTVVGIAFYRLPAPFEVIQGAAIEDVNSKAHTPLDSITTDEYEQKFVNNVDNRAKPERYFRKQDGIFLHPTPDLIYSITVYYRGPLTDLSNSNINIQLPNQLHEIVLFGAVWRAQIGVSGDYARAQAIQARQVALINSIEPVEAKELADTHRAGVEVLGMDYELQ